MYELCRHIKSNGIRCQAPALRGVAWCYFHARLHSMAKTKTSTLDEVHLPPLEDTASIQIALHQVIEGLLSSRMDARRAGLLLYAIQIASQNVQRVWNSPSESVHSTITSEEGDELAPAENVCEPEDCPSCKKRRTCATCLVDVD
jgi:hypothetical protein